MDAQNNNGNEQNLGAGDLAGGATDKGPNRSDNQDAFWIPDSNTAVDLGALYLVADGVGGQASGAEAAQMAVATAKRVFYDSRLEGRPIQESLEKALLQANQAVFEEAQRKQVRRMGATFVAAVAAEGQLTIAHVGDARAYLIRQGEMRQLTRDDTWVQKQVEAGLLTDEQAANHEYRNIVTQVLGNKPQVDVHLSKTHGMQPGDRILLCSDGLYDVLSDNKMLAILEGTSPEAAAQQLVQAAIKAEAGDNITAVVFTSENVPESAAQATVAITQIEQQPAVPLTTVEQPTAPAPPKAGKNKSKASRWLIVLAAAAIFLIVAAVLLFWLRNRDLDSTVEQAAGTDMTATALIEGQSPQSESALRPLPTMTPSEIPSIADEELPPADSPATDSATELPPPTPTLRPAPTIEATAEPRGCTSDTIVAFLWSQEQIDSGTCASTSVRLDVGEEVRILAETAVAGTGTCSGIQFIKVQPLSNSDIEGWVDENAINLLAPGANCGS
ncbi:MAG: protein phosphatase 2C domain-containing protein [Candidatus Promineifilaceae bacterium]|nr:protein phosphatase 2C domain-containing protein [Candidatus Promineifilaceae bacterium]